MPKNIIFIFSLPRSGSTLLQRLLMSHSQIHSVSEPWLLLPLAYLLNRDDNVEALYNHRLAQTAIADLVRCLPDGENTFYSELSACVKRTYGHLGPTDTLFFVDKTPRYFLIIDFIERLFPDAKFIFLFRNPLASLASTLRAFGQDRLGGLHANHVDLYQGPKLLVDGRRHLADRAITIRYEDLVADTESTLQSISDYLQLDTGLSGAIADGKGLLGTMGDKSGLVYRSIEKSRADSWREAYSNLFRIRFAQRYLNWLGDDLLREMGYSRPELQAELSTLKASGLGLQDMVDYARVKLYRGLTGDYARRVLKRILIPKLRAWR